MWAHEVDVTILATAYLVYVYAVNREAWDLSKFHKSDNGVYVAPKSSKSEFMDSSLSSLTPLLYMTADSGS